MYWSMVRGRIHVMDARLCDSIVIHGVLEEFRADGYQASGPARRSVVGPFIFVIIMELLLWRCASRSAVWDVGGLAKMDQDLPHRERLRDGGQDLHLSVLAAGAVEDVF